MGGEGCQAGGSEGLVISKANFEMNQISGYCIYSAPVFGILLVLTSGKVNGKLLYGFQKPPAVSSGPRRR